MMRLWLTVMLAAGAIAQSPEPQLPDGVYRVGGDVSPPRLLEKQEPTYSDEARVAKLQGTIVLSLVVGEDGTPRDLRVRQSLGLGLDENAVTAVSRWRFLPGMKAGQPVAVQTNVEVGFRLLTGNNEWRLERVAFNVPQGALRPSIVRAPYPQPLASELPASASLSFDVDEQGNPVNIHVDQSSDPQLEDEVTALIREWRFQAAFQNGIPLAVHGFVDFSRGETEAPRAGPPVPRKRD